MKSRRIRLPIALAASITAALLGGCGNDQNNDSSLTANESVNQLLDALYMERINRSPIALTRLGSKEQYGMWDDITDDAQDRLQGLRMQHLSRINKIDISNLDHQTQLSVQLAKQQLKLEIDGYQWRQHDYLLTQMGGLHTEVASILINQHRIDTVADADAYISRLGRLQTLFDQTIEQLRTRQAKHIMPPAFVLSDVVDACKNIISGAPFDDGPDSPLFTDFKTKVNALDIDSAQKDQLITQAAATLKHVTYRAYSKLIAFTGAMQRSADERAGIWKLEKGDEYYRYLLRKFTSTDMTPDEIHQLGLSEVKRIHNEMDQLREHVDFKGDLQEFFEFFRTDRQFFYPNTEIGRAEFLQRNQAAIENMKSRLPEVFGKLPKAELVVKAVEPYREASAGIAFYSRPAADGSRPGIYFINLYDMNAMPNYQIEATAYHEGVPGHHMQIAIAQELDNLPKLRKYSHDTAYMEGWALYTERLAKEMDMYPDAYSDFGRLTLELMRAIRLVVDTGIHNKQWTRQQAIDWFLANSPHPKEKVVSEIERYMVIPGQATAYSIGMLKILELREKAKNTLGNKFDLRAFHDLILGNGALPLDLLEQEVDYWISKQS
ncbi:DUF885 domain-containing protein [Porticoccaceae bacterium LTM1]|nr:DUF885 domain-containing protein [Porticoccaceae bacterium LTM1]